MAPMKGDRELQSFHYLPRSMFICLFDIQKICFWNPLVADLASLVEILDRVRQHRPAGRGKHGQDAQGKRKRRRHGSKPNAVLAENKCRYGGRTARAVLSELPAAL